MTLAFLFPVGTKAMLWAGVASTRLSHRGSVLARGCLRVILVTGRVAPFSFSGTVLSSLAVVWDPRHALVGVEKCLALSGNTLSRR